MFYDPIDDEAEGAGSLGAVADSLPLSSASSLPTDTLFQQAPIPWADEVEDAEEIAPAFVALAAPTDRKVSPSEGEVSNGKIDGFKVFSELTLNESYNIVISHSLDSMKIQVSSVTHRFRSEGIFDSNRRARECNMDSREGIESHLRLIHDAIDRDNQMEWEHKEDVGDADDLQARLEFKDARGEIKEEPNEDVTRAELIVIENRGRNTFESRFVLYRQQWDEESEWKRKYEESKEKLNQMSHELGKLNEKVDRLQHSRDSLSARLKAVLEELTEKNQVVSSLLDKVSMLEEKNRSLDEELASAREMIAILTEPGGSINRDLNQKDHTNGLSGVISPEERATQAAINASLKEFDHSPSVILTDELEQARQASLLSLKSDPFLRHDSAHQLSDSKEEDFKEEEDPYDSKLGRVVYPDYLNAILVDRSFQEFADSFHRAIEMGLSVDQVYRIPEIEEEVIGTVIHWAAWFGRILVLNSFLMQDSRKLFDLDAPTSDDQRNTPLILAVMQGHKELVQVLASLTDRVDLEYRNAHGDCALMVAVNGGRIAIAKALICAGCDLRTTNAEGKSVMDMLEEIPQDISDFIKQCESDRMNLPMSILNHIAEPDFKNAEYFNFLIRLCKQRKMKIQSIEALIPFSLTETRKIPKQSSWKIVGNALHWACWFGNSMVMSELINTHNMNVNRESTDEFGLTPLLIAAIQGHESGLKKLVRQKGINLDKQGKQDKNSALMYAVYNDDINCVRILLEAGAKPFLVMCINQ